MSVDLNRYIYKGEKPIKLIKWKVKPGSQIYSSAVILTYFSGEEDKEGKLKSDVDGMVQTLLVEEGQLVQPGDALLQLQSCTHEIIMKELCAQCGADLRQLSRQNLQEVVATRSFSMVHVVPELKCSLEQAKQLDEADESRLLETRKLILLVDLDQTLIHTTNENVSTDLKDVHHFQLYGSKSPWYHTRLRPHTEKFLKKMSTCYEMHIFTFGARMYAHKIASILDPKGILFSHRILSRDECFDGTSKTANLKSLFPRGDNMVCIIDDREDVWNFAPNVVHVKPYVYFSNTGDINAPPNVHHRLLGKDMHSQGNEQCMAGKNADLEKSSKDNGKKDNCDPLVKNSSDITSVVDSSVSHQHIINSGNENQVHSNDASVDEACNNEPAEDCNILENLKSDDNLSDLDDDDDFLFYLEEILVSIHKAYYDIYDEMASQKSNSSPDLKSIIPYVRRKVLQGVNIVFSGVIPTNMDPEKSSLWVLAKSFGANVTADLVLDGKNSTTHIIASKVGTAKLNKARKMKNIHVVTPSWLICCATRWERVNETLFPLKGNYDCLTFAKKAKKHMRSKEVLCKKRKSFIETAAATSDEPNYEKAIFPNVLNFSEEDLEMMGKEVNDACEEHLESSDSDSLERASTRHKRKRANNQMLTEDQYESLGNNLNNPKQSTSHDSDCEELITSTNSSSICSSSSDNEDDDNDELAAAVEEKLLSSIPSFSN